MSAGALLLAATRCAGRYLGAALDEAPADATAAVMGSGPGSGHARAKQRASHKADKSRQRRQADRAYDFQRDANMAEVRLCDAPLRALQGRLQALLARWPTHDILHHLCRMADRIRHSPLSAPLAQVRPSRERTHPHTCTHTCTPAHTTCACATRLEIDDEIILTMTESPCRVIFQPCLILACTT
jgi:hypothetical protein